MISCAQHDYIEIACLYGFEVKLVLRTGQVSQGKAVSTAYNESREECLVLENSSGIEKVVLSQLVSMEAITRNPHFDRIDFK